MSKSNSHRRTPRAPANVKALSSFFEHNDLPLSSDRDDGGSTATPDFLDKAVELHLRYDLRLFFELRADAFPDHGRRFVRVVADPDFEEWKEKAFRHAQQEGARPSRRRRARVLRRRQEARSRAGPPHMDSRRQTPRQGTNTQNLIHL
ncbi:hypothetical protein MRX96_024639 [Rhipicephalus microplus]